MRQLPKLTLILILFLSSSTAFSQVPGFEEVTGQKFGTRITLHHQMLRYVEMVAEKSPRATLVHTGKSWEGRELVHLIITDPANHSRLDQIKQNARLLADPRITSQNQAREIIANQPSIFWIGGSIHGFELSGSEGVLMLIEKFTTSNDPEVLEILQNTVLLADPMLNPDGRDAFANLNHENIGKKPNSTPIDWSNTFTSWQSLKFRTGHYYFDTNRDWFIHSQLETRNRVGVFQEWKPQAGIDAHEMGSDVEFYIDPPTDPVGPFFPDYASTWFKKFAAAHSDAFDEAGIEYMVAERFNYFYPGYTTSYMSYQGGVGMLYEQGSSRGLALDRPDKSVRTLYDAAWQQYIAAYAAIKLAAKERIQLQTDYYESARTAVNDGRSGIRRYYITPEAGDPGLFSEMADLLTRNGIEVQILESTVTIRNGRDRYGSSVSNRTIPAGSIIVDAAQPRNRFIRVMLEPKVPVPADFLKIARERVNRGENPRFYDVTSWSLPLLFNLQAYSTGEAAQVNAFQYTSGSLIFKNERKQASYAYLLDGTHAASLSVFYKLKELGYRASLVRNATKIEGIEIPSGSILFRVGQNPTTLADNLYETADFHQVKVIATNTGRPDPGFTALGSGDNTFLLDKPVIAILAEDPVSALSFGFAWYTLDRLYDIPVTVIRSSMLNNPALNDFNVLIIPEVNDTSAFKNIAGNAGVDRLRRWVNDGGTLVTIGASGEVARGVLRVAEVESFYDQKENSNAQRIAVPGAFFRTKNDSNYWLNSGVPSDFPILVNSNRVYRLPEGPPSPSRRPVITIANNNIVASGHAWEESIQRLPGAIFAYEQRSGRGRIIMFAEEINFRSHWRGANRIFLNAVILGPSGN